MASVGETRNSPGDMRVGVYCQWQKGCNKSRQENEGDDHFSRDVRKSEPWGFAFCRMAHRSIVRLDGDSDIGVMNGEKTLRYRHYGHSDGVWEFVDL
jgi:hypothetical protein